MAVLASPLLRWGSLLSIVAAVALAVALRYQQQQQPLWRTASTPTTYCYRAVRTQDQSQPSARCFSVRDGIFSKVWSPSEHESAEMSPKYVIPGLWDGHGHLMAYGEFLHSVDLFGAKTIDEVRARIKSYIKENPEAGTESQWLRGVGWDQNVYGRMPTADDIEKDPSLRGIYMMLDRIDVHCTWVSKAVLNLLPEEIPDVPGGEVIRDPGLGVFCDNAMDKVMALWPKPGRQEQARAVKTAMRKLNELGLVGMHDASTLPSAVDLYAELADTQDWTVRVYSMLECDKRNTYCPDNAVKLSRPDGRFTVESVKLFADGALGSWGSAMIDPYTDHPWTSGSLLINASALTEVTKAWASAGYQVNIHAIGDLANRNAIDAFVAALEQECPHDTPRNCQARRRFRIEHAQIIHPDDQKRMHALGIIPSIQPTHATSDMKYALDRLGPDRTDTEAYRMRSFLDIGPILGSDFPVEPPNPFEGIYAAVARKSPATGRGPDGEKKGWHTDQALSLDQALWGFTGSAAYGAFLEDRAGIIKEGAFADWVVLDNPLDEMDVEDLRTLRVRETWVGGNKVYSRN